MYWGMYANSPPPLPHLFDMINVLRYTRACTVKTFYVSARSSPPLLFYFDRQLGLCALWLLVDPN